MTWTKLSDDFPDRLIGLSDAAFRLHVVATVYANRLELDGVIPKTRLALLPVPRKTRRAAVVRELVAAGLWIEGAVGIGRGGELDALPGTQNRWTLVDFAAVQPSAEEAGLQRAYAAIRQRIRFAKEPEDKALLREEEARIKAALFEARERRRSWASALAEARPARRRPENDANGDAKRPVSGLADDEKRLQRDPHVVANSSDSGGPAERGRAGASHCDSLVTHNAPAYPVPSRPVKDEDEDEGRSVRRAAQARRPDRQREPPVNGSSVPCAWCAEPVEATDDRGLGGDRWVTEDGTPEALHYDCQPPNAVIAARMAARMAVIEAQMRGEPVPPLADILRAVDPSLADRPLSKEERLREERAKEAAALAELAKVRLIAPEPAP